MVRPASPQKPPSGASSPSGGLDDGVGKRVERGIETIIFLSRWVLTPFYVGLSLVLFVLLIKFGLELIDMLEVAFTADESSIIIGVLALVDLTFTASLVVIVIFSGYENFVSKIDVAEHQSWPDWMAKIDFSGLKMKLFSSIVAISGIQLLKVFMEIKTVDDRLLIWSTVIHVAFVGTGVLLALMDRLSEKDGGH